MHVAVSPGRFGNCVKTSGVVVSLLKSALVLFRDVVRKILPLPWNPGAVGAVVMVPHETQKTGILFMS